MMKKTFFLLGLILFMASCSSNQKKEESKVIEESSTDEKEVVGEELSYSADSVEMKGYVAYDPGIEGQRPGVLVVHEWWGHNDYARKRADMLAKLGYVALAVDMYGGGKTASHPDDAGKFATQVMSNADGAKTRFMAAMQKLKNHPMVVSDKIAAIGYCFGGSVVLTMANMGVDLEGVAAFHSGLQLPVMPQDGEVDAQVLVCNGADDPFIPEETVEDFKAAMDAANVKYEYVSYEGAKHSFTREGADSVGNELGLPLAYNEEADKDSWSKLKNFLENIFSDSNA